MQLKLLFDFGLVILIWMTQLIVYPSFTYYQSENLIRWHQKYTRAITIMVMPLMFGQIGWHSYDLFTTQSWLGWLAFSLILLAWINTFFYAVPLHHKIANNQQLADTINKLVMVNWYRTIWWTMVFIIDFYLIIG